jgi:amidase
MWQKVRGRLRCREPLTLGLAVILGVLSACEAAPPPPPPHLPVLEATLSDLQGQIQAGAATCRIVVQSYLNRIAAYDRSTDLQAISEVNPRALIRADSIDAAIAAGEPLGPLFCAPVLVKDNYDTHDLPTTGGSSALAGSLPPDDAFMVRKLREAGAIVLGKTNMAEWAFSPRQTVSSSYGVTANAYALDRVPAGSSGGTASGVAASFGVAGLGTDTGNSIRGPSSHLALFGIRSTIGLTSRDGVIPLAFDRDIAGPMARTVEDAARLFNVVAGYDPADPYTEAGRGRRAEDYTDFLDPQGLQGARIGVLRALADPAASDTAVLRVFDAAVADLERLGATVVDPFTIPNFEALLDGPYYCNRFRWDVAQYLESRGPDTPIKDVAEVLETGAFSPYVEERIRNNTEGELVDPETADPRRCAPYATHTARQRFMNAVVRAMDAAEVDVIAYPTWTHPPAHLALASEEYRGDNSQRVAPATGLPASTVPMGYTYGGLPAGLQFLARPYDEPVLFRLSYSYEQGTLHRTPPEAFPALPTGM